MKFKTKHLLSIALAFSILFFSQNNLQASPKKKKIKKKIEKVTPPAKVEKIGKPILFCQSNTSWPNWYLTSVVNFQFATQFVKPANYRLFQIDEPSMISFLKTVPYQKSTLNIQVPIFMNGTLICKEFKITRVETMDSVLQAKYPALMSFKGEDKDNALNTARIDCDETSTKFMINYNGETYFVTPMDYKKSKIYVAYAKSDPNFIKQKFEQKR